MQDKIKKRIQELVPSVMPRCERCEMVVPIGSDFCKDGLAHLVQQRKITLAVVLMAIQKLFREGTLQGGYNNTIIAFGDTAWRWNLEKDNYDDQTQETRDFIGVILGL